MEIKTRMIEIEYYNSPCGELILGSFEERLCLCDWVNEERRAVIDRRTQKGLKAEYVVKRSEVIAKAISQLDEYFNLQRTAFDVPLLFVGTDFQKAVWLELLNIPYGETTSYAVLSQRLSNPKAVRAVAAAIGANSISIIVPCHRVIGSNNHLTGYAGGLDAKRMLLKMESKEQTLF